MDDREILELASERAAIRGTRTRWPAWVYGLAGAAFSVFVLLVFEAFAGLDISTRFKGATVATICICFLAPFGLVLLLKREYGKAFEEELERLNRDNPKRRP